MDIDLEDGMDIDLEGEPGLPYEVCFLHECLVGLDHKAGLHSAYTRTHTHAHTLAIHTNMHTHTQTHMCV